MEFKQSHVIVFSLLLVATIAILVILFTTPDDFTDIETVTDDLKPFTIEFVFDNFYIKNDDTYIYAKESTDPEAQTDILKLSGNYSSNLSDLNNNTFHH